MEKLAQAGQGGSARPPLFTIFTITYKVAVYAGQIHSPYFISTPMYTVDELCWRGTVFPHNILTFLLFQESLLRSPLANISFTGINTIINTNNNNLSNNSLNRRKSELIIEYPDAVSDRDDDQAHNDYDQNDDEHDGLSEEEEDEQEVMDNMMESEEKEEVKVVKTVVENGTEEEEKKKKEGSFMVSENVLL